MDSLELSKILGATCAALLLIFGTKTLIDMRLADHGAGPSEHTAAKTETKTDHAAPAAADATATPPAAPAATAPAAPVANAPAKPGGLDAAAVVKAIGAASADSGKATFNKCLACHTAEKGVGNKLGPNLWGVVGRPKGSIADFNGYSAGMKAKGGDWTFEELAHFVSGPSAFVTGTKMVFPGVKDPAALADLLAYIRTLADSPAELPK